ncbi:MAG: DUF4143 domain-containing protein [Blautia sp.]|nr:DUF4143 domain-containing protein [Blautia sp.]
MKDFETAIEWLLDCGLITKVFRVNKPAVSLKAYVEFSAFKLFLVDIGLLGAMSDLDADSILDGNDIFTEFNGALTEQYVLQQLISDTDYIPYYYATEKANYEMDFIVQKGKQIVPVEVKAEKNLQANLLKYLWMIAFHLVVMFTNENCQASNTASLKVQYVVSPS